MNENNQINRLKKVLIYDKELPSEAIQNIIKSDIINVLKNYTSLDEDSVFVNFNLEKTGGYNFTISGKVSNIKNIGLHIN